MATLNFLAIWVVIFALLCTSCVRAETAGPATRPVVVVELFTSEGCSSCRPADALLSDLAKPARAESFDVIPLSLHVDYWNHLGWADPFSSAAFSDRQRQYARWFAADQVYTPQMIVDGREEFVGSDRNRAGAAIRRAATAAKGHVIFTLAQGDHVQNTVACKIVIDGIAAIGSAGADVWLAVTEDDLASDVSRGESAGRVLRHTAVVRALQRIATIRQAETFPFSTSAKVDFLPVWRSDKLHVIALVQDSATGRILAAGQIRPSASEQTR